MKKSHSKMLAIMGFLLLGLTLTSCDDTEGNSSSNVNSNVVNCPDGQERCDARNN